MNAKGTAGNSVAIWIADSALRHRLERLLRSEAAIGGVRFIESAHALLDLIERGEIEVVVSDVAAVEEIGALKAELPPITRNGAGQGRLTPRELEVLAAMADGASNKAIARRLDISVHTAKFHVAAILAKLDADSRTEAVMKAAQLGLVML
jgi:DNA-binding CsgD family transcriptional regulator